VLLLGKIASNLNHPTQAMQHELTTEPRLLSSLFDGVSDVVWWFNPVLDATQELSDFRLAYRNSIEESRIVVHEGASLRTEILGNDPDFERIVSLWDERDAADVILTTRSGQVFTAHVSFVFDGLLLVIERDASGAQRIRQAEHKLEMTAEALQQANERLTEFTYVASHDLNEPLRKVTTFTRLLGKRLGESLDNESKEYMIRIERSVERMQELLDNLLIYSRVSRHQSRIEHVSLNEVVRSAMADLSVVISQRKALIRTDDLPIVTGDHAQLKQAFQNLISNALKFQANGAIPELTISYEGKTTIRNNGQPGIYEVVAVSDNGIGFEESEAENIFRLFHRLHSRHEFDGTGIGLPIVRRVMENHHGFVRAENLTHGGARFILQFPQSPMA
jgi:signal transduction histidine kinase